MAQRVNTRFLTILLLIVIGTAGAIVLLNIARNSEHPDHYISLGEQAEKDHDWPNAIANFSKAESLGPKDPRLPVMLAHALAQTTQTDPTAWAQEVAAYRRSLVIDPKYEPALKALSQLFTMAAQQSPDKTLYEQAIDYTTRAREVDPKDETLQSMPPRLVIEQWRANLSTDQQAVDKAVKELTELRKKYPANADLPYAIATAKVQEGMRIAADNPADQRRKDVTDLYNQAVATFESALTGKNGGSQDRNAAMHLRFAEILEMLGEVNQITSPDLVKGYRDRSMTEIARARALVKVNDPQYMEINEFAGALDLRRGDPQAAIAIYRKMPQELPQVRLDLGDTLSRDPATRDEGIRELKSGLAELQDDPNHIQLNGLRYRLMKSLVDAQVSEYETMPESPARHTLHDEIEHSLAKLDDIASYRVVLPLKQTEGRFRLAASPDEKMQEVVTLSKLMSSDTSASQDYYLEYLLAQGYMQTNQRADALGVLKTLSQQFQQAGAAVSPEMRIDVKKNIVNLLLTEQPDQVPEQLDELAKLDPGDPSLVLFRIQYLLLDTDKNKDQIKQLYAKMDESTPEAASRKARVAVQIKDYNEADRLLQNAVSGNPHDVTDVVLLARVLSSQGKSDEAMVVAKKALAANPDDPQLKVLIPAIKGVTPEAMQSIEVQLAKENPDKVQGELMLAAMASRDGNTDGEEQHLKAAEKLSPESPHVQELLFDLYLRTKHYAQASAYVDKLGKADVDRANGAFYQLELAEAQNDLADAERIARKLVQDRPEYSRSWLAMGDVLRSEKRYDDAVPQYLTCLQKQSNIVEAYVGLVECYYGLNRPADALATIKQGLDRVPDDQTLQQLKLTHEMNYGLPADAVAEIEKELNARPDQPELYAAMAEILVRYAGILDKNHQHNDAITQSQEAVSVMKKPLRNWPDEGELYVAMSKAQLAAGQPEDSLATLKTWAARDAWKGRPDPYISLADFYETTGNREQAEDALRTALARSGYAVNLQIRMASLLALHGKFDESLQLLRAVNSDRPAVQEKIVQILLASGKFDEADAELKKDLAAHPPDSEVLLQTWAVSLLERKEYAGAVERATEALAENPSDPTALYCRGRARLLTNPADATGALADLTQLQQSNPNSVEILQDLATAHALLHQMDDTVNDLESALRLDPRNKQVRMKLVNAFVDSPHPRITEAIRLLQEVETTPPFDKDASIFQGEAVLYNLMHNNAMALDKSETAVQLAPGDESVVRTNMQILVAMKRYQPIVNHYAALQDKWKGTSWALWDLAMAEKNLGNAQAQSDMKRALTAAINEDDPPQIDQIAKDMSSDFGYDSAIGAIMQASQQHLSAKLTLAHLYQAESNSAAALAAINDIMAGFNKLNHRDQVNVLNSAAVLYQMAKPTPMVDKAYDAYQQWLRLEPDNLEALNNMACLLADDYSPPRAQEGLVYANRAVAEMTRLGETEPQILDTQGWLTILNGAPEDGVVILNNAMTEFEPFPDEYLHVAEGYMRMRIPDPTDAETQAKLGLQLLKNQSADQQDPVLRAKLKDLINRSEEMRQGKQQAQVP